LWILLRPSESCAGASRTDRITDNDAVDEIDASGGYLRFDAQVATAFAPRFN
jgi:hypothetical protein